VGGGVVLVSCASGWRRTFAIVGVSLERIATDLGVCEASVSRWVSPVATTGKRKLIEVAMTSGLQAQGLVVVTPRGYRLEGVSEGLALRLLREL
jgi:hypothetical protein